MKVVLEGEMSPCLLAAYTSGRWPSNEWLTAGCCYGCRWSWKDRFMVDCMFMMALVGAGGEELM